mmetsp:Transcript_15068/g.50755  ORF Transcript_15068/g.50755 Transcript_15068/m.50755 type:complete len:388 (-) Transcript_15068:167-1330(-)
MLQADKQVLLAGVKRNALELRQKELDFNVERFTNLATQASVIAGFSFESLVELEVPEDTHWLLSSTYFVFGSAAMAMSLYCLVVSSFACVFGHRLALQGPHGSLEKAVTIMVSHRLHIFAVAGASLLCLVLAAVLMAWIKMGPAAGVVSAIFLAFGGAVSYRMHLLLGLFQIPESQVVTGAVQVNSPNESGAAIDLSRLNPSAAYAHPRAVRGGGDGGYQRLADVERGSSCSAFSHDSHTVSCCSAASTCAPPPSLPGRPAEMMHHEGHLFKKAEAGFLGKREAPRRRYFVLRGPRLYYFRAWEDYGAGGFGGAINADQPIDMRQHEPMVLASSPDGPNRFDLLPTGDPSARKWELQAPYFVAISCHISPYLATSGSCRRGRCDEPL